MPDIDRLAGKLDALAARDTDRRIFGAGGHLARANLGMLRSLGDRRNLAIMFLANTRSFAQSKIVLRAKL